MSDSPLPIAALAAPADALPGGPRVSPGTVLEVAGQRLLVAASDCKVWARLALPVAYTPVAGDEVLVLAQEGAAYVIGVLQGHGPTAIHAPGDLDLQAAGVVRVRGSSVALEGREVEVRAGQFRQIASAVKQRFGKLARTVTGTFSSRSGAVRAQVEGDHKLRARRIVGRAQKEVRLDGDQIQLG